MMLGKLLLSLFFIIEEGYESVKRESYIHHIEFAFFSGQCSTVKNQTGCISSDYLTTDCYCNSDLCNDFLANEYIHDSMVNMCYEYSEGQMKKTTVCNGSCMTRITKMILKRRIASSIK